MIERKFLYVFTTFSAQYGEIRPLGVLVAGITGKSFQRVKSSKNRHFRKSNTDTVNVDGSQRLFMWYNVNTSAVCIVLSETFRGIHVPRTKR